MTDTVHQALAAFEAAGFEATHASRNGRGVGSQVSIKLPLKSGATCKITYSVTTERWQRGSRWLPQSMRKPTGLAACIAYLESQRGTGDG